MLFTMLFQKRSFLFATLTQREITAIDEIAADLSNSAPSFTAHRVKAFSIRWKSRNRFD